VDGSNAERIAREGSQSYPNWSPDGKYLLLMDAILHEKWGGLIGWYVVLYNLETRETTQLPARAWESERPDWSQDSQRLLFSDYETAQLCPFNIAGEETDCFSEIGWNPTWNADNTLIAYEDYSNKGQLCVRSLDVPLRGNSNQWCEF
jgi:Tol biopolymer transport system component